MSIDEELVRRIAALEKRVGSMSGALILPSMQTGWDSLKGSAASGITASVTFPTAFSAAPQVIACALGCNATKPTTINGFSTTGADAAMATSITASGFTIRLESCASYTFSASFYYGFAWVAIA